MLCLLLGWSSLVWAEALSSGLQKGLQKDLSKDLQKGLQNGSQNLLFDHNELITIELTAPFKLLLRDRHAKSTYHAGELRFADDHEREIALPVEIRTRGKTRRRKDICAFPPLRLRFAAGTANTPFEGQRTLKLVTHCNNSNSFDQYVLQEYLAYRVYNQLTERGHRVRLAKITFVETAGQVRTTRFGIFLEDWRAVAARNGLGIEKVKAGVNVEQLSRPDANRVAVFQFLIGNEDWSVFRPEPNESCCHNTKPLLAPDGTVVPLPYDFDFSGIVDAPYAVAINGSSNVRLRRYGGLCSMSGDLPDSLARFEQQRQAIYALYQNQPEISRLRLKKTLRYLDGFYRVIGDPDKVERQMIRRCRSD
jgi:hypothetical protein